MIKSLSLSLVIWSVIISDNNDGEVSDAGGGRSHGIAGYNF
jgi:hypothetical protein